MRPAYNELTRLPHLSTIATGNHAPLHLGTTGDAHAFKKITYPGGNNKTEFIYGPGGERAKVVETTSGSISSTQQFIAGEVRDGSGNLVKQFFSRGQRDGSTNYFLSQDHLGSTRNVTDDSGVVQASYSFDPYGRATKLYGSIDSDFGFAGMRIHARSGLNLTVARAYSSKLGMWLSRDPVGESGGVSLYNYTTSDPIGNVDPLGLLDYNYGGINCIGYACGSNYFIQMSPGQSLKDLLGKDLGFKCKKVKSSAQCKCPPGSQKMMVYITHYSNNPNNLDPYSDPWVFGGGNDIHAFRQDNASQWSFIPGIAEQFQVPPTIIKRPEDYFNAQNQPLPGQTYCCCKCPK